MSERIRLSELRKDAEFVGTGAYEEILGSELLALIEVAEAARSLADEYSGFLACTGRVLNVHADDQHLHVLVHALARFDFSEGDAT